MSDELTILENTVRASFAGVVWSHKIQEKQADIYRDKHKRLETMRITASGITSVGIASLIFINEMWIKIISAAVSLIVIVISAYFKSFNMQEMYAFHKKAANSLLIIRDKYQHLLMEIHIGNKGYNELNDIYIDLTQ